MGLNDISQTKKRLIGFEKKIAETYQKGIIKGPIHLADNNEEWLINKFKEIKKQDWVFTTYRNHYHALLKGIPESELEKEILNGNSMHIMNDEYKFYTSSIVAGHLPIAVGAALALKLKKSDNKVFAFCGDMAAETGMFNECEKYSIRNNLPIEFIIEDNGLSVDTPTQEVWGEKSCKYLLRDSNSKEGLEGSLGQNSKTIRYHYKRGWPHHGMGLWVEFPEEKQPKEDINTNKPLYKEELNSAMNLLAKNEKTFFIGQTVEYTGSGIYATLEGVSLDKRLELPVAEDLQMGISTGLALEGYIPVSIYPRFDFFVLATNQLVNHLDKTKELSGGRFNPKVIMRTMIGSKFPLYPGPQHCQDHTEAYKSMLGNIDVIKLEKAKDIVPSYEKAMNNNKSTLLIEVADLYNTR